MDLAMKVDDLERFFLIHLVYCTHSVQRLDPALAPLNRENHLQDAFLSSEFLVRFHLWLI